MHTMLRSPSVALSPAVMIEARLLDVYIPQPELEAEATLADDCYEIEALLADPAVEADCPEIEADDGSPAVEADCPEIEALLADGSPAVEADGPGILLADDSPAIETIQLADSPEIKLVNDDTTCTPIDIPVTTDAFISDPSPLAALVACPYQATVSERLDALERDTTSVLQMFQRLEPRISLVLSRLELSLAEGEST
jgi:hypothetical protein